MTRRRSALPSPSSPIPKEDNTNDGPLKKQTHDNGKAWLGLTTVVPYQLRRRRSPNGEREAAASATTLPSRPPRGAVSFKRSFGGPFRSLALFVPNGSLPRPALAHRRSPMTARPCQ